MIPTIGINAFLDRQRDPNCGLTHWEFPDEELVQRAKSGWDKRRQGYRDGVVLIPVSPVGFKAGMRILHEGDELRGSYTARRPGELPRKFIGYASPGPIAEAKVEPRSVDLVLYSRDTLAEDQTVIVSDWDIIAVLGKFCSEGEEEPMDPGTLMANHFKDSGGTATGMTPEQFETALRRSYYYWRDKAQLG